MGFEIKININEESPEGRKIREIMASEEITPEEIVRRSLNLYVHKSVSPAMALWGAFSDPVDSVILDEAMEASRQAFRGTLKN